MASADVPWAIRVSLAVRIGVQRERELDCQGEEVECMRMRAAGDVEARRVECGIGRHVVELPRFRLDSGATAHAYTGT